MSTTFKPLGAPAVEAEVIRIVRALLSELGSHRAAQSASVDSSLEKDLGLGSLERVELLVRCEARFDLRLPDDVAQHAETPAEWVRAILERGADEPVGPVVEKPRYRIEQPSRAAPLPPDSARNWVEVLRWHAEFEPGRVHVHLLQEDGGKDITYEQLLQAASEVALGLRNSGLRRDETVAVMLPTCADFFYAFFGVMLAGGIAVPIYPPARPDKIEEYVRRQVSILRNAEVRFLITFDRARAVSEIMRLNIPTLLGVTTVGALLRAAAEGSVKSPPEGFEPSEIGFIQYTSGSTGDPKGVALSHSNILENVRGIGWAVKFRVTDIVVSWLPLYHDMGLIGSWLFSVYFGAPITMLSPLAFLSRPERWLWALHESRGTLCPAPNFAYELCARKIPERALEGLDLSAWRVAINAGEAVLPETLTRFAERFAPYGFRPESFVPCYGLAESSVALTFPPIDRRPLIDVIRRDTFEREGRAVPVDSTREDVTESTALRFVANGRPLPGHGIRVADAQGRDLGERVQGRVLFRGPSTTSGYYRNPEATAAVMTEDGWMDSGDLGYCAAGELFISGRSKDCIIKSGRNIIPQEVETAAAEVRGVRRGCVAAFGVVESEAGTERLVVVAETRATRRAELRRLEGEIARRVNAVLGIPPNEVVLVPPQSIPKTSSGKIRRNETRLLYERGDLKAGKRPPWLQMLRLSLGSVHRWLASACGRLKGRACRAYHSALLAAGALWVGWLARLVPSPGAATKLVFRAARWLLRLSGERVTVERVEEAGRTPVVFMANYAGRLDPLVLAASLPWPFLIADTTALAALPREAAFLLKPLLLAPLNGELSPPGGTLRQRIRRGLEQGHSVLVLSDSRVGAPARLSRFRLDPIHAALMTSAPIVPVAISGTSRILEPVRSSNFAGPWGDRATVRIGKPIYPAMGDQRELVAVRERVREALARLCESKPGTGKF